ncbi:MAG: hypothetical protein G01um101448_1184 [Parcubacteria group bacterium Gr01-1014_48]|nr:MAG: hypothetical protein G01um101448_1184 [Parcubacteria group bacterium Gr01-1014_48]
MVGTVNCKNKTLPQKQERNEEGCEHGHPIVAIEPVIEPIVIPIPRRAVAIQIPYVAVAVRVAKMRISPSMPPPLEYSRDCIEFEIVIS